MPSGADFGSQFAENGSLVDPAVHYAQLNSGPGWLLPTIFRLRLVVRSFAER